MIRTKQYISLVKSLGPEISISRKTCRWENDYQESFYSQFEVDLEGPNRFNNPEELVYNIYSTISIYNHKRIHLALRMPPNKFARRHRDKKTKVKKPLRKSVLKNGYLIR